MYWLGYSILLFSEYLLCIFFLLEKYLNNIWCGCRFRCIIRQVVSDDGFEVVTFFRRSYWLGYSSLLFSEFLSYMFFLLFLRRLFVVYLCKYVEVWYVVNDRNQVNSDQNGGFSLFREVFLGAKMELPKFLLDVSIDIFNIFLKPVLVSLSVISLWSYDWFFEIFRVVVLGICSCCLRRIFVQL